jgi:hypothetical protein
MSNLTQREVDEIKAEAYRKYPNGNYEFTNKEQEGMRCAYEWGAKEERQRAKVLADALWEIIKSWDNRGPDKEELKENKEYGFNYWSPVASLVDSVAIAKAREALNTYNKTQQP